MAGRSLKNARHFDDGHKYLAEELLQPNASRCDLSRTNMWCSHFTQAVVLTAPEPPRVYSGFENEVGKYTTAVKRVPDGAKVIGVFNKNPLQVVYALELKGGVADIHFASPVRHLTEDYGYPVDNSPLADAVVGTKLGKGALLQSDPCHDEFGNFMYGTNLRTVYANVGGRTYEDGIIISESAAQKMTHVSVKEYTIVINANDLTVNAYGEPSRHQGFPDVGEDVVDGVLLARRRINHEALLFDLSDEQLSTVNWHSDTVFYSEGTVVDVDIHSNLSIPELEKHPYNAQLLRYEKQWQAFRAWVLETFKPYMRGEGADSKYTESVGYHYKRVTDTKVTPETGGSWKHDRSEFDGVVLRILVAKENPAVVGSKLTNRYGGKGVVSQILPDSEMPRPAGGGRPAELICNSLGVINRLNPAQLIESELNFIADAVADQMRPHLAGGEGAKAQALLLDFLGLVAPAQAAHLASVFKRTPQSWQDYADAIAEGGDIMIHQPPVVGTVTLPAMREAYRRFGVEKRPVEGGTVDEPLVFGTNYYLKLRHEPASKHSARSAKHLSISGVPTKNNRGVRTGTEHHSATPIRIGEQEVHNLLIPMKPDDLSRLFRIHATDDSARSEIISRLLTNEPFRQDRMEPRSSSVPLTVAGMGAYLESAGLTLGYGDDAEQPTEETANGQHEG